jgi:hypothetical protein
MGSRWTEQKYASLVLWSTSAQDRMRLDITQGNIDRHLVLAEREM